MIVFDQINKPASGGSGIGGAIIADNFTLSSTTRLTGARFRLGESFLNGQDDGVFDGFSGTLSLGIFTLDHTGKPDQLIYQVNDMNPKISDAGTFVGADLFMAEIAINNLVLPAGKYAVGIQEGPWLSGFDGSDVYYVEDAGSANGNAAYAISGGLLPIYTHLSANASFAIVGDILPDTVTPSGSDKVILMDEDTSYTFRPEDFGYSDGDGDAFLSVIMESTPAVGAMTLNGKVVPAGSEIAFASIKNLTFTPPPNANGAAYATFTFQVKDDGEANLDPIPNTITLSVAQVNDPPIANDDSAQVSEDRPTEIYVLANDTDADLVKPSIIQTSNPMHGLLQTTVLSVIYIPDPDFFGTDTFTYTISDANGVTDTATVTVTVVGFNDAPVANDDEFATLEDNPIRMLAPDLLANDLDVDGDSLTITSIRNIFNGTAALNPDKSITFTPASDYSGIAGFDYVVVDPSNVQSTAQVRITVIEADPVVSRETQTVITFKDVPANIFVEASDPQDDPLSFGTSTVANGSITGGQDGAFVYTPDVGFSGTDEFTVFVSDGKNTTTQMVSVRVIDLDAEDNWQLLSVSGFAGSIGGRGDVFGTSSFQDITVLEADGLISVDPSFNKGGDIIRLLGDAADWQVMRQASSAILFDGHGFIQIPVGIVGLTVAFDDGVRTLRADTQTATMKIGAQAFGETLEQVTAPADGAQLPTGAVASATARLLLGPEAIAAAAGKLEIFGSNESETIHLLSGEGTLDSSFNRGGDTLILDRAASEFVASRVGSSVFLDSDGVDVLVPVGKLGMTIEFADNEERILLFDTDLQAIVIGSQQIGFDPLELSVIA